MKLFTGKSLGDVKQIALIDVISDHLKQNLSKGTTIEVDESDDEGSWIELSIREGDIMVRSVVLSFSDNGHKLTNIAYYETPVKIIIEDTNTERRFHS